MEDSYPMRVNKYLAHKGYATRRKADELISAGLVTINGKKAVLGDKVVETDKVVVDAGTLAAEVGGYVYVAYHKPRGVMSHSAPEGKLDIEDVVKVGVRVSPIGRLDQDSHGLIILTNDGRVTDRLLNPKYEHEKEYVVKVNKPITENFLSRFAKGVKIEDGITKPAVATGQVGGKTFHLTIVEGKKHQIRRRVPALGSEVTDLQRVRIMDIRLGNLEAGKWRKIVGTELKSFLSSIGL